MKKYFFIAVAFFGMLFVTSCESDDEGFVDVPKTQELTVEQNCKTLAALEQYNLAQKGEGVETRGFWNWLKRIAITVSADVVGAGTAIVAEQATIGAFSSLSGAAGTIATVAIGLGGAIPASIKAWTDCAIVAQYEPQSQVLNNVRFCGRQNLIISEGGPQKDYSTELPGDNIFAQIDFPAGMDIVKATGVYHNLVINDSEVNLRPTNSYGLNGSDLQPHDPGDEVSETLDNFIMSSDYASVFNTAWNNILDYMGTDSFNYNSYFNSICPTSSNVKSTYLLFLQALNDNTSVTCLSDVIDLVNDYVDIIEANNEFSQEERVQIYAGLAVAAYSYKLWSSKLLPDDGEELEG